MGSLRVLGSSAAFIVRPQTNALKMQTVNSYDTLVIVPVCHIPMRHVLESRNLNLHL